MSRSDTGLLGSLATVVFLRAANTDDPLKSPARRLATLICAVLVAFTRSVPAAAGDVEVAVFDPDANSNVLSTALQTDGKIVIAGEFTTVSGVARQYIARVNPDATLDEAFDPNANSTVNSMVVEEDGKILVGGSFTLMGGTPRNRTARLNADGTPDMPTAKFIARQCRQTGRLSSGDGLPPWAG